MLQGPAPQQGAAVEPSAKTSRDEAARTAASQAGQDDAALLRQRVAMLEQELADSEHTHQLRSATCCCPWNLLGQTGSIKSWSVMCNKLSSPTIQTRSGKDTHQGHLCLNAMYNTHVVVCYQFMHSIA